MSENTQPVQQIPTDVLTLIETRLTNEKKSTLVAYLLWFFLGSLGVHHFYLRKSMIGLVYALCTICGGVAFGAGIAPAGILLAIVGIGLLIDLFRIPSYIRKNLDAKREELVKKYRATGSI